MSNQKVYSPAVILGLTATGLAVARSLGRRGLKVIGISSSSQAVGACSKYIDFLQGPDILQEEEMLSFLSELAVRLGEKSVLLPTGDQNVLFISKYREMLEKNFMFVVPRHEILSRITSKEAFIAFSEELGLPLPKTYRPKSFEDAVKFSECIGFPCILKPEFTHLWLHESAKRCSFYGKKAICVESRESLLDLYKEIAQVDPHIILQKAIIGADENHIDYHAFVDNTGCVRAEFIGRKIRLVPPHFGMGCFVESVESEQIAALGRSVLEKLNYLGMANINFKQDCRDNQFYIFEINPRFSFWTGLDVACGVDFPYYYYMSCVGEKYLAPSRYKIGIKWLNLEADLQSMLIYSQDGTWSWWRWLRSLFGPKIGAVWAWDDPKPGINRILYYLRKCLLRRSIEGG